MQSTDAWLTIAPIAESRSSYNGLLVFLFIALSVLLTACAIHVVARGPYAARRRGIVDSPTLARRRNIHPVVSPSRSGVCWYACIPRTGTCHDAIARRYARGSFPRRVVRPCLGRVLQAHCWRRRIRRRPPERAAVPHDTTVSQRVFLLLVTLLLVLAI